MATKMLSRTLTAARPLSHQAIRPRHLLPSLTQIRCITQADIDDPGMNGGYINPPPEKRQFRDPYADWWDKQERRNFGEPLHEDHDVLGMFSPHVYTHFTPRKGFFLMGCFIATVLGLCGVVRVYYPDRPSVRRAYEGGLDRELGGPGALLVSENPTPA
ncbi:MAG: hypothetical protein L6R37_002440 [Teloschistes peruensis]|nr:MAG: hypothetical protein L6R37_002440 [Teloschistes peruensis]